MSEYIVFVGSEHYNSLGIIRTLGESGIKSIAVIVKGEARFVGQSRYVKEKYYVDDINEGLQLIKDRFAKGNADKSFILTGDDDVVAILDKHYSELVNDFYFYNAGENGRITHFMNKDDLIALVSRHGLPAAKTWHVRVGEIPSDIEYPVMTKAVNSISEEWKEIVHICHDDEELMKAYSTMKSEYILLQRYVDKVDEVSFDGFSINHGKDLEVLTEVHQEYCISDNYSPYWDVRNNGNAVITEKIRKVIAEIGLEGIFEFEFIVDKDGNYWFLEINFRNTALGYSTTIAGMPQVILWCEAMVNGRIRDNFRVEIPTGLKAMAECFDYDARVRKGLISRREWFKQYRNAKCKMYKGHDDIVPFLRFLWYKYTKMRRRNK